MPETVGLEIRDNEISRVEIISTTSKAQCLFKRVHGKAHEKIREAT